MVSEIRAAAVLVVVLCGASLVYTHRPDPVFIPLPAGSRPAPGQPLAVALHHGDSLDLNRATVEDLAALPGVGIERARRIVRVRNAAGRFRSVEDLDRVPGIGARTLERLRPLLHLSD